MVTVVRRTPSICPRNSCVQRDDIGRRCNRAFAAASGKSRFQGMQRIARHRLPDLRQQQIVVAHDQVAKGLALRGSGMKVRGREPRGRARQLHDCPRHGRPRSQ